MPADPAAVKSLFLDAAAIDDPAARAAFVNDRCGEDAVLRARVNALLVANDRAVANAGTMSSAGADGRDGKGTANFPSHDAFVGVILAGKYKLIEEIGEGGMGSVFMAQQTEPVKRAVAVKVIKAGMDSRAVLARFEAERQALAMMDHPNIAQVFDAGTTTDGRPFFVMELVKGMPITQFCDERKLTPRQRLELFVPVCQAIQHAHQKGIIHRDIKPSNVLVAMYDDRAVPKVIDFGVAKATGQSLTDQTLMTGFGAVVGTPEYMSPEQANLNNLDIDTRSDVYSLGVLLYELLTGTTPVDRKSLGKAALLEVLRIVREVEPQRPSTRVSAIAALPNVAANRGTEPGKLSKLMKGELDCVLLKALEKDRTRRYETANGLARDLQRYLADDVVEARPPSTGYRLKKFVRRHRGQVVAASLVLFVLLVGIAGTTWGLIEARRQEQEAKRQEQEAKWQEKEAKRQEAAAHSYAEEAKAQAKRAGENARKAETEARLARNAEQQARERATAEAAAKALAQKETQRAEAERKRAEEQLTRAELLVYAGKLSLAHTDFVVGNGGFAVQYLNECQQKLRGWEHRHLWSRISPKLTLQGHTNAVTSAAFSPDGKRIVTGSHDSTVRVWDAETGKQLLVPKGITSPVNSVAFSPDGKRIVSSGNEATVRVWDAATGKQILALKGHTGFVNSVAYSPDGKRIVTGGNDGTARVWDTATGKEVFALAGHTNAWSNVAFSPDSKRIVTGSAHHMTRVWDTATGKEILALKGHTALVSSVAFSPDGKRIVTGSHDATVRVWDAATGKELFALKGGGTVVYCAVFSPDGTRIVSGRHDITVRVWDGVRGQEVLALEAAHGPMAFSPDGKRIVTGSLDHTARVWDTATGKQLLALKGHTGFVNSVAYSRDGKRIVTGSDDATARVWDTATGKQLLVLKGHTARVMSVAISPDGKRILSGGGGWGVRGEAKVWDAATGKEVFALQGHTNTVTSVAFSPDGKRLVTASGDSTAKVWNAATGKEVFTLKEPSWVFSVAYSADGKRIVTGSFHSKTATVWDAATGKQLLVLEGHVGYVTNVAYSADGKRIATSGWEPMVRVWDADSGQQVLALKVHTLKGPGCVVSSVAFSPDGTRLLTGVSSEGAKVWAAEPVQATWPLPDAAERKAYHSEQAALAVQQKQWFAAGFHLRRVLRDDPENATVKATLAGVASEQKKFALAARLWAEVMARDPKLGEDRTQPRYHAARAAVLASAGRGEEEPPLDDAAKAKLRRQALDWLKAELTACGKQLASASPQGRSTIVQRLSHWQKDGELAGIRDKAALDKLPAEEQKAFTQLWADAAELLKKAQEPPK
jgi:WD40 repeat protein/serine/threonine protein kinase